MPGAWPARYLWVRGMRVGGRMPQQLYLCRRKQSHVVRRKKRPCQNLAGTVLLGALACVWVGAAGSFICGEKTVARRSRGKTPARGAWRRHLCGCVACVWVGAYLAAICRRKQSARRSQGKTPDARPGRHEQCGCVACVWVGACRHICRGESSRTSFARKTPVPGP
jgi:hypothetical protein